MKFTFRVIRDRLFIGKKIHETTQTNINGVECHRIRFDCLAVIYCDRVIPKNLVFGRRFSLPLAGLRISRARRLSNDVVARDFTNRSRYQ